VVRSSLQLVVQRLIELRRKELEVHGPATRGVLTRDLLDDFLAEFDQLSRDHNAIPANPIDRAGPV
jgi:hypothetical protein